MIFWAQQYDVIVVAIIAAVVGLAVHFLLTPRGN